MCGRWNVQCHRWKLVPEQGLSRIKLLRTGTARESSSSDSNGNIHLPWARSPCVAQVYASLSGKRAGWGRDLQPFGSEFCFRFTSFPIVCTAQSLAMELLLFLVGKGCSPRSVLSLSLSIRGSHCLRRWVTNNRED